MSNVEDNVKSKIQKKIAKEIPKVEEANLMATELKRKVEFQIRLDCDYDKTKKESVKVIIVVLNKEEN